MRLLSVPECDVRRPARMARVVTWLPRHMEVGPMCTWGACLWKGRGVARLLCSPCRRQQGKHT